MTEFMPLIMFATVFALLLLGFPVAFTIGGVAFFFGLYGFGPGFFELLPLRIWGTMTNFTLLAVPLFIYMGVMLEKSGLAEELLEAMALVFGKIRGGLAISVIFVGALMGASTGIVGATVVTMGLLSVPTMLRNRYNKSLTTGTVAASGTLGQIIPPSIVLVLLGDIMNVPVGDLFIGAIIPGLILVVLYMLYIFIIANIKPEWAPPIDQEILDSITRKELTAKVFKALLPPLVLMISVLGSIFAGIASPTEAASVGAVGATLLTALHGRFNYQIVKDVMDVTTKLTCMVFIILVGASTLGLVFRGLGGDALVRGLILSLPFGRWGILFIVMVIIFIAGFFLDFIEITFIHVPVLAPIMIHLGVDPLWLAVLIAVNLQTSFLTPPFGFSLFYLKGVTPPEIKTTDIYIGIIPFVIIQIIGLLIICLIPEAVTWLPKVL
ncbi:MAG: TRAP transporter large permease subunit [Proteobacteria bacterium]|nr:TRAP transporter large permease subunit [Pseudomonadota bacterium]MBU1585776.1 TRAP transporter large permease subunit [Pseudomonadota bacterium]MBU2452256.1 TRAP transporter large permease subunit [Pseudomonadota bacterium]MBU2632058.1 TRAP transporter large permease subunit [Pseudomonadota bacterium]